MTSLASNSDGFRLKGRPGPDQGITGENGFPVDLDRASNHLRLDNGEPVEPATDLGNLPQDLRHLRSAIATLEIRQVVADHEQLTSGLQPSRRSPHNTLEIVLYEVQIGDEHEVVETGWLPGEDVRDHELDVGRSGITARDGNLGEVDRRHPPATLTQPDSVPTLPTGEVHPCPRFRGPKTIGDEQVRPGGPEPVGRPVSLVPTGWIHLAELDSLGEGKVVTPVDGRRLTAHVSLPGI